MPTRGRSSRSLDSPGVSHCIYPEDYPATVTAPPPLSPRDPHSDGGIAGFHGLCNTEAEPVAYGPDATVYNPLKGTLAAPHDEVDIFQRRHKSKQPESHERELLDPGAYSAARPGLDGGRHLRRVDPMLVPAAGSAPASPVPGMALFDAPSKMLFDQKSHASKPPDQLAPSMQGAVTPRGEGRAPGQYVQDMQGRDMARLLQNAHAPADGEALSPAASPENRRPSPRHVADYCMPEGAVRPAGVAAPEPSFPHKRVGAFAQRAHVSGSGLDLSAGEGVLS